MGRRINFIARVRVMSRSDFEECVMTGCHEAYKFYRRAKFWNARSLSSKFLHYFKSWLNRK